MQEGRPVADPKLMGRPVDEKAYEPTPKERPVDDEAYEPMPEGRPVADPKLMGRPVDEKAYKPTPKERPVDDEAYEPMPEGRPVTDRLIGDNVTPPNRAHMSSASIPPSFSGKRNGRNLGGGGTPDSVGIYCVSYAA